MPFFFILILISFFLAPILTILSYVFVDASEVWTHLVETRLFTYISNSVLIMLGTGFLSVLFGFIPAWILNVYKFRGSRYLEYVLMLPLAFPTYIVGYIYSGIFGFTGSFWLFLVDIADWFYLNGIIETEFSLSEIALFDVMSLEGAIFVMSFVLYPYVYLMSKNSFYLGCNSLIESSKSMGFGLKSIFFKVSLSLFRPSIVAGVTLVMMEAGSDYGLVDFYGIDTFVTGIFRTWSGQGNLPAASKMASIFMLIIFFLVLIEKYQRKNMNYSSSTKDSKLILKEEKKGFKAFILFFICFFPFFFGFLLPFLQMLYWSYLSIDTINSDFIELSFNTFFLSFISALFLTCIAILFCFSHRVFYKKILSLPLQLLKMGYSVPGIVISIGIIIFIAFIDNFLIQINILDEILFGGSIFALVYGYSVRFLSIGINSLETAYSKIPNSYDEAAKSMGKTYSVIFWKIHRSLIKNGILVSYLILFVEILKELPLTLVLRPFNFETLPTLILKLNVQEMLIESSIPSLIIVLFSLIPVLFVTFKKV